MAAGMDSKVFVFVFKFLPVIGCTCSSGWLYIYAHTDSLGELSGVFFLKYMSKWIDLLNIILSVVA